MLNLHTAPAPSPAIDIPYAFGGTDISIKMSDIFSETPITNCAVLNCHFGDVKTDGTCDETMTITEPNIVFATTASPYTLTYKQDFKNGYGAHEICLRCRVTNDGFDDFKFSIKQQPLNCDLILTPKFTTK